MMQLLQNSMQNWQALASLSNLQQRADILENIRNFFKDRSVLEVSTPILSPSVNPDINIQNFQIEHSPTMYLQTSPELHMKRLLATHKQDIYQITKSFRKEENGGLHNFEFTMLEWYRVGLSYLELAKEVVQLIQQFLPVPYIQISYQDLFKDILGLDPFTVSIQECEAIAQRKSIKLASGLTSVEQYLDLFLGFLIEPKMPDGIVVINDFLPSQALLARINQQNIAERFEVYVNRVEIANGFTELCDPIEQKHRFINDNVRRQSTGLSTADVDDLFIASLEHMPECSGVALGVDRLVMQILSAESLDEVVAFRS